MGNVQDLFWCDGRDEQGCLLHAPDCDQRNCFVVQGKKQDTNTGGKAKLPDHYRCTITCAFCGKKKHYEDKCYHKQCLSAKLKTENASGKGSGKGNADKESGQGKSKGDGKGQGGKGKGKGGRGGSDRKPDRDKNANQSEGTPILRQGRTLRPLVGNQTQDLRPVPSASPTRTRDQACQRRLGPVQRPQTLMFHAHGAETSEEGV